MSAEKRHSRGVWAKPEIQEEERDLREVLELMLETKVKKLGFPAISLRSPS